MRWEFATATRIVFGTGAAGDAAALVAAEGRRPLVVTGSTPSRAEAMVAQLQNLGLAPLLVYVEGEPEVAFARDAAAFARRKAIDVVVAIGGGSAIDAGKAIAALATNTGDIFDYLEVVGRSQPLTEAPLPFVAIPTTAGTGAEVTRNAVLAVPEHRVKVSLRSPLMLPRVAVVDPALTYTVPPDVTAFTGLDALTQVLEPFLSRRATPLVDALCRDALRRGARALPAAWANGDDVSAREDMAFVSLCGGLALANAGLGAVHGLAGPIGGMFAAPHGAVCAVLLPHVLRANLRALRQRTPDSPVLGRATELACLLTDQASARTDDAVDWLEELVGRVQVPGLSRWGLTAGDIPALVAQASRSSSMAANPVTLESDELDQVLRSAL